MCVIIRWGAGFVSRSNTLFDGDVSIVSRPDQARRFPDEDAAREWWADRRGGRLSDERLVRLEGQT